MINGFFYYIINLYAYPYKLFNSNILQTINAKNIDNLPTIDSMDIILRSKILDTSVVIKLHNEKFDLRHKYTPDYEMQFYEICNAGLVRAKIEQLYRSITKSLIFPIKQEVVKSLIIYHPFLRISNINERMIYTFFIELKMFNGESLFVIVEEIPDTTSEEIANYEQMKKYVNDALYEVRMSYWKDTENYNYPIDPPCTYGNTISFNYILSIIVERTFEIDLSSIKGDTIITYYDEQHNEDILMNGKTKCSFEFNVDDNDCLFMFMNSVDYFEYLDVSAYKTMPIIIINYFISNLNKLIQMNNQTLKSSNDIQIYLRYILQYSLKEKIKLPLDVQNLIDTNKKNTGIAMSDEVIKKIGLFTGALLSAFLEKQ